MTTMSIRTLLTFIGRSATALAMAADYLAQGCKFTNAEMTRVASLPAGAERDATKRN